MRPPFMNVEYHASQQINMICVMTGMFILMVFKISFCSKYTGLLWSILSLPSTMFFLQAVGKIAPYSDRDCWG